MIPQFGVVILYYPAQLSHSRIATQFTGIRSKIAVPVPTPRQEPGPVCYVTCTKSAGTNTRYATPVQGMSILAWDHSGRESRTAGSARRQQHVTADYLYLVNMSSSTS